MHLLLGNMHGSTHETAAAIAAMRGRVDGLLVMPPDLKPELLADYLDPALPTVLLNYDAGSLDLPFVAVDNYRGAYAMTEALLTAGARQRSEEHTSELQSLMRNSYAVFCLKKKNERQKKTTYSIRLRDTIG